MSVNEFFLTWHHFFSRPFGITIAIWSILVGSVGNLLTILTYVSNLKLRTTFNLFLVNLAVIDFWTATGMLPFNLAGYIQMQWWVTLLYSPNVLLECEPRNAQANHNFTRCSHVVYWKKKTTRKPCSHPSKLCWAQGYIGFLFATWVCYIDSDLA